MIDIILKINKNTEIYHDDFNDLNQALTCMQDVATYINEIKRRRELSRRFFYFFNRNGLFN